MLHCQVRALIVCLSLHLLGARVRLRRFCLPRPHFPRVPRALHDANTHSSTHRLKPVGGCDTCAETMHTPCYYYASGSFKLVSSLVILFDFPPRSAPPCSLNVLFGLGQSCRWFCPFASHLLPQPIPPLQKTRKPLFVFE